MENMTIKTEIPPEKGQRINMIGAWLKNRFGQKVIRMLFSISKLINYLIDNTKKRHKVTN